jgi:hypothetical protein
LSQRSGGVCECGRLSHVHRNGRCPNEATAKWEPYRDALRPASEGDPLSNAEALCIPCHTHVIGERKGSVAILPRKTFAY